MREGGHSCRSAVDAPEAGQIGARPTGKEQR